MCSRIEVLKMLSLSLDCHEKAMDELVLLEIERSRIEKRIFNKDYVRNYDHEARIHRLGELFLDIKKCLDDIRARHFRAVNAIELELNLKLESGISHEEFQKLTSKDAELLVKLSGEYYERIMKISEELMALKKVLTMVDLKEEILN